MKSAWDAETMGYGKHAYREIDPESINPEEYAQDMRGDQIHKGEVREYEIADNRKHPDNQISLDWLSRVGTVIESEALGDGKWEVIRLPVMNGMVPCCVLSDGREEKVVSMVDLGCVADIETNEYKQVPVRLVQKITIDRKERARLTAMRTKKEG